MNNNSCKNFQDETVKHIVNLFKEKDRVLLADEVGLGKTIVARDVIKKMSVGKKNFKVLYVCSSQILAAQNIRKLGGNPSDSPRLSMLFLKLKDGSLNRNIIPVSPGTSVKINNAGLKEERKLLFAVLTIKGLYPQKEKQIRQLLKHGCSWESSEEKQYKDQLKIHRKEIVSFVKNYLEENQDLKKELNDRLKLSVIKKQKNDGKLICELRKMLVRYTLSLLKVDLVVMDEFQKFRDLLEPSEKEDGEENILYEYFLNEKKKVKTKILLISATPYSPFTSKSDEERDFPSHYNDFVKLFNFLYDDVKNVPFEDTWKAFVENLKNISRENLPICVKEKKKAEKLLFNTSTRTERTNRLCVLDQDPKELTISEEDVLNFVQMQNLCKKLYVGDYRIDYAKSTPYSLSFMDDEYVEKRKILTSLKGKKNKNRFINKKTSDNILLSKTDFEKYHKLPLINSKYSFLSQELFGANKNENHFERLLWIPPSKMYYEPQKNSVFWKNKNASKMLIFSAWRMVPKSIVALTNYESESRLIGKGKSHDYTKVKSPVIEKDTIFDFCSPKLASFFKPSHIDKPFSKIKEEILESVKENVENICQNKRSRKFSPKLALEIVKCIQEKNYEKKSFDFNRMCDFIANYIIASPVECACRIFKAEKDAKNKVKAVAVFFRALFNRHDAILCINAEYSSKKDKSKYYIEKVFDYCVQGNLQAVLDEFLFMSGNDVNDFCSKFSDERIKIGHISADTRESLVAGKNDREKNKFMFRTHFSSGYYKDSLDNSSSGNLSHIIEAFNSPFRPFVFATTSVGEEGLDFHKYCRRIMHWNLPDAPIEFEQREGRINRFCSLAIRQNLCELFWKKNKLGKKENFGKLWEHLLKIASKECQKYDKSGMSPYWILPSEYKVSNKIESLVPVFPFSKDQERLDYIYKIIEIYRMALGQPNQEEVLNHLIGLNMSKKEFEEVQKKLEMNLSPYFKNAK